MNSPESSIAISVKDKEALHKIAASEKKSDKQYLHEILVSVSIVPRDKK
jgi:hypothetical protein